MFKNSTSKELHEIFQFPMLRFPSRMSDVLRRPFLETTSISSDIFEENAEAQSEELAATLESCLFVSYLTFFLCSLTFYMWI